MKKVFLVMAVVLAFGLVGVGISLAQSITYSSSYQLQNLDSGTATVSLQYYDQTTGNLAASGTITISGNASKTIFPFTSGAFGDGISGPATFNGSLVASSDKQIAAILNTQTSSSPFYGASTDGFTAGATKVSLPLIACNNAGFNTWFNIQNAGTADAHVTITYIPGANGVSGVSEGPFTIKQGAAKTFNQAVGSTTKNCNDLKDGSGKFVGSASITSSDQPIVASVMFLGTGNIKTLQGYDGFSSGSASVNLPLIMANNSSYYTSINLQNGGTNTANVTITFRKNTIGNTNTPNSETFQLGPGQGKVFIQNGGISAFSPSNNWTAFGKYVGGAVITQNGTSEPLFAVVNQNSTSATNLGSAYEGFDPTAATGTIKLPLIAANNSGYNTSINLQAIDDVAVTVNYGTNTGGGTLANPAPDTKVLKAGDTWVLIQKGVPGPLTGVNNWSNAGRYVGSATVTAQGGKAIAIINFTGPTTSGDTFFTYDGFNTP